MSDTTIILKLLQAAYSLATRRCFTRSKQDLLDLIAIRDFAQALIDELPEAEEILRK